MNVNNVTVIIKYLSETDPCLREIIRTVQDFSLKIRKDPFQSLVESIIYQQLAGSANTNWQIQKQIQMAILQQILAK
jgi:3-methyladenine DNA glycosylase/8-oxoguanine DNA glycosylase